MGVLRNWRWWIARVLPGWMRGEWGTRLTDTFALAWDALSDAAMVAVKASWLKSSVSPNDAVAYVGTESGLPRYPSDTDAGYRARVDARWVTWPTAGKRPTPTTGGVCEQLKSFGLTDVEMIRNYDWRTKGPPGDADDWSRFWIVLKSTPWERRVIGGGTIGSGTIGSTATVDEIRTIRRIVNDFRAGGDVCAGIFVVLSGTMIGDLGGTIGGGTIGGDVMAVPGSRIA